MSKIHLSFGNRYDCIPNKENIHFGRMTSFESEVTCLKCQKSIIASLKEEVQDSKNALRNMKKIFASNTKEVRE